MESEGDARACGCYPSGKGFYRIISDQPEPVECPECSSGLDDDGETCDICGGHGIISL